MKELELVSPEDYNLRMSQPKNKASIKKLSILASQHKACTDCFACRELSGHEIILLGATRQNEKVVQCEDCFNTFRGWSLKEISSEEVPAIFATRRVANVEQMQKLLSQLPQ